MAARDLIEKMLQVDANRRYSAQEMLEHPWMKTVSDLPSIAVLPDFLDKIIDRVTTNDKMYVGVAVCVTPYIQQLYNYYIILVVYWHFFSGAPLPTQRCRWARRACTSSGSQRLHNPTLTQPLHRCRTFHRTRKERRHECLPLCAKEAWFSFIQFRILMLKVEQTLRPGTLQELSICKMTDEELLTETDKLPLNRIARAWQAVFRFTGSSS